MSKKIFTKKEAKDLTRKEQLGLLSLRNIEVSRKDREVDLVRKILKSNPEIKEAPKEEAPKEEAPKEEAPKEEVKETARFGHMEPVKEDKVSCVRCGTIMNITDIVNKRYRCPKCMAKRAIME